MANRCYKWSVKEKLKLIKRYNEYGWQPKQYHDFKCTVATCKAELIGLGYIKED